MDNDDALFNIQINVKCQRGDFRDSSNLTQDVTDIIYTYGMAIRSARIFFSTYDLYVRKDGYLQNGLKERLGTRKAILEVDDNLAGLLLLLKLTRKGRKELSNEKKFQVHIHYLDTGTPEKIEKDEFGFYLSSIKNK